LNDKPTKVFDPEQESRDLGFGSVLSERRDYRLLNRDGSFNADRPSTRGWRARFSYHALITMSWPRFFGLVIVGYVCLNALFAAAYLLCGAGAIVGSEPMSPFLRAFFFSIHTFATIGYGNIVPAGIAANLVVTAESLIGLLSYALATGLLFARFSRPTTRIIYSRNAVVAPYRGISGFMFRLVNGRENELVDVDARVILGRFEEKNGKRRRVFHPLTLERDKVAFFPVTWTVVHPIDESSPLRGWTNEMLAASEAEFLILLTAHDETFAQTVHSRSSYVAEEVVWSARFVPVLHDGGRPGVNLERFHSIESAELPAG